MYEVKLYDFSIEQLTLLALALIGLRINGLLTQKLVLIIGIKEIDKITE